jgi:hypothetical protein
MMESLFSRYRFFTLQKNWSLDKSKQLNSMLKKEEQEWVNKGYVIRSRETPKKFNRDLDDPVSKPDVIASNVTAV